MGLMMGHCERTWLDFDLSSFARVSFNSLSVKCISSKIRPFSYKYKKVKAFIIQNNFIRKNTIEKEFVNVKVPKSAMKVVRLLE